MRTHKKCRSSYGSLGAVSGWRRSIHVDQLPQELCGGAERIDIHICSGVPSCGEGTASTTPPINGNAKGVVSVWRRCPWSFCPIPSRLTFRPHHADDPRQIDAAWVDFAGPRQGADGRCSRLDAGRGRVLESMSWSGCCNSACVQCLGLTGACAACSHCTATAWELSDLDHSHAATPQRVTRASCAQLLRSMCLAPPAVDLLEAIGRCVCMRRAYCFSLMRISHFCCFRWAASSGLARRRFPSLASSSWSKRFDVAHCHSHGSLLLRRLVCTSQACCLFAHVALLLLPLSLFLGVRAPSLSLCGFRF